MVEVATSLATVNGQVLQGATEPRYIDVYFGGKILRFDQQMTLTVSITKTLQQSVASVTFQSHDTKYFSTQEKIGYYS